MARQKIRRALAVDESKALKQVAFDPGEAGLDLAKDEKLRATALMMAIQYVTETICKDAEMYRELKADGKHLASTNVPHVVTCAIHFEQFLLGRQAVQQAPDVDVVKPQ